MFFKSLHILGVLTSVLASYRDSHEGLHGEEDLASIKLNPRIVENRNQLKRVIKYLNGHSDDYERTENKVGSFVSKDTDVDTNIVNEQERIVAALSLLQKNYNKILRQGNEERRPRLLYINNPEVLEEYKSNLRGFFPWSSSDSADYSTEEEVSGHRKFDVIGAPKAKTTDKRSRGRSRHKTRGTKVTNDPDLGTGKKIQQKGRFKVAREKIIPQIIEGKRPKIEKKVKLDDLDISNLKFETNEKLAANVVKEFPIESDVPRRPKKTETKYDTRVDTDDVIRKKPAAEHFSYNKRGGNVQSLGRTFIPYIATKTVYEDD